MIKNICIVEESIYNSKVYKNLIKRKCTKDQAINLIYNFSEIFNCNLDNQLYLFFNDYQLIAALVLKNDNYYIYSLYGKKTEDIIMNSVKLFTSNSEYSKFIGVEETDTLEVKLKKFIKYQNSIGEYHIE